MLSRREDILQSSHAFSPRPYLPQGVPLPKGFQLPDLALVRADIANREPPSE